MNTQSRLVTLALALALASAALASPASAALLLSDDFTATSNERAGALDHNIANRQAGSLATTNYTTGPGVNPNIQLGNTTTLRSGGDGNYLLNAFGGTGSLNQNFNAGFSAGGLEITFDVSANLDTSTATALTNWTAINIGLGAADQISGVNANVNHFGILFRANGGTQAFDGNTAMASGDWSPMQEGGVDNFDSVRLLFTDPGDNNPFDGVGVTQIDVFSSLVGGGAAPIYSFTKTGGGYTDNFINFQSNSIGGIDNLAVTQIPEPAGSALLALGLCGLALRRRPARLRPARLRPRNLPHERLHGRHERPSRCA